jgi:hypothetical protein
MASTDQERPNLRVRRPHDTRLEVRAPGDLLVALHRVALANERSLGAEIRYVLARHCASYEAQNDGAGAVAAAPAPERHAHGPRAESRL